MLAFMNQFTGVNGVMYYATQILAAAGIKNVRNRNEGRMNRLFFD